MLTRLHVCPLFCKSFGASKPFLFHLTAITILTAFSYALRSVALARESHARESLPNEDYWQAVWPNTPVPSTLEDLLKPTPAGVEIDDLPMEIIDDTFNPKAFFFEQDLYPGKTVNVQFSKHPLEQPYAMNYWRLHVKDVDKEGGYTSDELCVKEKVLKGEHRYCAKSLGPLMGFAISRLGENIQALSSSFVNKQEQYTVEGVQNLGLKTVQCHRLNFQKATFYCHEVNPTTAFMVSLEAADGTKAQALAVCHDGDHPGMNHQLLRELMKVDPGSNTVCHFLGNKDILWVPNLIMDNDYHTNIV
ncbi:Embryonic abundant protein VF30.1 [Spatholobus suberectus]|nr:Embryonic abundant protein VF30.1 [Spatholobus suberectus]